MSELNANGNGAPKSPYIRLAATDEAFGTIEENLAFMIGQKFYASKKAEIEIGRAHV